VRFWVLLLLLAGCKKAESVSPPKGYSPLLHSHNDYLKPRPLHDALDHHFQSVEADLFLAEGVLQVGHVQGDWKGTLSDLYLDPLAARVAANGGSVHGDDQPFYLWIDLKQSGTELPSALRSVLDGHPMLTRFGDTAVTPGAVTIVLTGNAEGKLAFVEGPAPRPACRDSNDFAGGDPPADTRWLFYALDYVKYGADDGLSQRVKLAHEDGRKVRLWRLPDGPSGWTTAINAGVDFVGTDKPGALAAWITEQR
jgi:hypothetical protein